MVWRRLGVRNGHAVDDVAVVDEGDHGFFRWWLECAHDFYGATVVAVDDAV